MPHSRVSEGDSSTQVFIPSSLMIHTETAFRNIHSASEEGADGDDDDDEDEEMFQRDDIDPFEETVRNLFFFFFY